MQRIKNVILLLLLLLAVWAFWPQAKDSSKEREGAPGTSRRRHDSAAREYVIKVSPEFYMPGTMPWNVGEPLEGFSRVAEEFEALYPDTRIEFVGVPSGLREWLVTQLSSGQAPDIFHVNVEDVWQDVHKGWYLPLDRYLEQPNPFVAEGDPGSEQWWDIFKYQAITRGKAAPDGKNYCITLDMVETGIFYNKDIFQKVGVTLPKTWQEFLEMMEKLRQAGYIPILMWDWHFSNWGMDLIFDQLYCDLLPGIDLKQDPVREQYLQGYLDWDEICFLHQKGFFTRDDPRFLEMWRLLKQLRHYTNQDLNRLSIDLTKLFVTQKGAMVWDGSWLVQRLTKDPDIDFEWGILYPPPMTPATSPYATGREMCVIGGSGIQLVVSNSAYRDTGDPDTSERLKRCIAFLQFLTTPENTGRVVNEISALLPNVKAAAVQKALEPFDEILQRRYTTAKWTYTFDLKFNEILERMLGLYLNDGISEDEFLDWMERNFASAIQSVTRRKRLDLSAFEARWQELAPERRTMKDLPRAS